MTAQSCSVFITASILLALAPGPDILTVIVRSVTQGLRAGLAATLGFASGLTVHTTLAALGIAAILKASPAAFAIIRYLGVAYLLYLALRIALSRQALNLDAPQTAPERPLRAVYAQSFLMNVLNPKVTLFFLGFLPGFITPPHPASLPPSSATPAWAQIIFLGFLFALCTLVCFSAAALFAASISRQLRKFPSFQTALKWTTVALFLAIAAWIAFA